MFITGKNIMTLSMVATALKTETDMQKTFELKKGFVKYIEETVSNCCIISHKMLMCRVLEIARSVNTFLTSFKASKGREVQDL